MLLVYPNFTTFSRFMSIIILLTEGDSGNVPFLHRTEQYHWTSLQCTTLKWNYISWSITFQQNALQFNRCRELDNKDLRMHWRPKYYDITCISTILVKSVDTLLAPLLPSQCWCHINSPCSLWVKYLKLPAQPSVTIKHFKLWSLLM